VRQIFEDLLNKGVIIPSDSPYSSPLVLVPKKDGSIRPCVDYRRLNEITVPDQYPLPRIEDIIQSVHGTIFSTLDLKSGYHQIPMDPADAQKTAVITPFGLFHFIQMPFGLRNAGATFQRFLDHVTRGLPGVAVYVDDLLVSADSLAEHNARLLLLFQRLQEYGLKLNKKKCVFAQNTVQYLGYSLSPSGYSPHPDRVQALASFGKPTNLSEVKRFIGMANFYRQHIPHFAGIMAPLYMLKEPFTWGESEEKAFIAIKEGLSTITLLQTPNPHLTYHAFTDASNHAVGATVQQKGKPLSFFSARLSPTEQRYSTFDREALAIIKMIKAYKHWFLGAQLVVHTDHKPLLGLIRMKDPSPRQARWIAFISEFNVQWEYEPGLSNVVADFLSRPNDTLVPTTNAITVESIGPPEWKDALRTYQVNPAELPGLKLERFHDCWYDTSQRRPRLVVPPQLRRECFDLVHNVAHFGVKKTLKSLSDRFVWKSMRQTVQQWCAECQSCQAAKYSSSTTRSPMPFMVHERFHTVHIDIVGPLPISRSGKQYLLTMIDHFTRWVEAVPINTISAEHCAAKFLEHWVCRYGVPVKIVSDQGTQFESALFNELLAQLGIQRHRTTTYHPQSNGAVERVHRTIKQCLRAIGRSNSCWERALPLVLLGLRTSIHEATQFPPSQLVFGGDIRAPADFVGEGNAPASLSPSDFFAHLCSDVRRQLLAADENQPERATPTIPRCKEWIWLRQPQGINQTPLKLPYTGPFKVVKQDGVVLTVDINGKLTKVNIDRVKPAGGQSHASPGDSASFDSSLPQLPTPVPTNPQCKQQPQTPVPTNQQCKQQPTAAPKSQYGRRLQFRFGRPQYTGGCVWGPSKSPAMTVSLRYGGEVM
jgi:cleavage and polyadenylation specificity factor subunit 1